MDSYPNTLDQAYKIYNFPYLVPSYLTSDMRPNTHYSIYCFLSFHLLSALKGNSVLSIIFKPTL